MSHCPYFTAKKASAILAAWIFTALFLAPHGAHAFSGQVVDGVTRQPLAKAFITLENQLVRTDADGRFTIVGNGKQIGVRAYGHDRVWLDLTATSNDLGTIDLTPVTPKALYLSLFGISSRQLRHSALHLIATTELNAMVIDVKGDRGLLSYKSDIPMAAGIGAQKITTIKDIKTLVGSLHRQGIYVIARIVVFKDTTLALARPDLAVKTMSGAIWRDQEDLAWVDPFKTATWDYNIAVAVDAAKAGFDEIQFDYIRFPDTKSAIYSKESNQTNRVEAISGFLEQARQSLQPYNVFISADVFGYVLWNLDDTGVGQRLAELLDKVDYLSPMLYPSAFQFGIPGDLNPVKVPFKIVNLTLKRAQSRTGVDAIRFRPWLQGFRDYAFDRRPFAGPEIRAQIDAAEDFGSNGWMLWNPRNVYSQKGLAE